jgi:signal transduction histidine kinase
VVLMVVVPTLLLIVGGTTWRVTGGALAPVEAIRREVDAISASELHRRVPDPRGADEIARLAGTMNRMLDRLERSQAQQRRFVSDASHELRSPVAAIRQYAEVATVHPESISSADLAAAVLVEDLRVQRLIDDLLLLARADEAALPLLHRPVDLDDLVLAEAGYLRRSTELLVDTRNVSAGRLSGDRMGLARVLRNLGENAARHANGRIRFTLEQTSGRLRISVEDDGPGIPVGDRIRVFRRPHAPVPEQHLACAVLLLRNDALEFAVFERVVLGLHREALVRRVEARALRHRPALQRPVELEAEVVMQPRRGVTLNVVAQRAR